MESISDDISEDSTINVQYTLLVQSITLPASEDSTINVQYYLARTEHYSARKRFGTHTCTGFNISEDITGTYHNPPYQAYEHTSTQFLPFINFVVTRGRDEGSNLRPLDS